MTLTPEMVEIALRNISKAQKVMRELDAGLRKARAQDWSGHGPHEMNIAGRLVREKAWIDANAGLNDVYGLILDQSKHIAAWMPIDTSPEVTNLLVGWHEDGEFHMKFDAKVEGCWIEHADHYEHFCAVASEGMRGPREVVPYTHWRLIDPPNEGIPQRAVAVAELEALVARFDERCRRAILRNPGALYADSFGQAADAIRALIDRAGGGV